MKSFGFTTSVSNKQTNKKYLMEYSQTNFTEIIADARVKRESKSFRRCWGQCQGQMIEGWVFKRKIERKKKKERERGLRKAEVPTTKKKWIFFYMLTWKMKESYNFGIDERRGRKNCKQSGPVEPTLFLIEIDFAYERLSVTSALWIVQHSVKLDICGRGTHSWCCSNLPSCLCFPWCLAAWHQNNQHKKLVNKSCRN